MSNKVAECDKCKEFYYEIDLIEACGQVVCDKCISKEK